MSDESDLVHEDSTHSDLSEILNEATKLTKGQLALLWDKGPRDVIPLPLTLRKEEIMSFDTRILDMRGAMVEFLQRVGDAIGTFTVGNQLESYTAQVDIFRSFKARQMLYKAVALDTSFLAYYECLLRQIVLPHLATFVTERVFYCQWPPSLRVQPGPSESHGRIHCDAEYGHQPGELNFWMPLTFFPLTGTTLWAESSPGLGDFHPLPVDYGQLARFHGTACRHYVPGNSTSSTRVSMDFRVGLGRAYFDPEWQLSGVKVQHGRKKIEL